MKTQLQNANKGDWILIDRRYHKIRKIRTFYDTRLGIKVTKFKVKGHALRAFRAGEIVEICKKTQKGKISAAKAEHLADEAISKGLEDMLTKLGLINREAELKISTEEREQEILKSFSQDVQSEQEREPLIMGGKEVFIGKPTTESKLKVAQHDLQIYKDMKLGLRKKLDQKERANKLLRIENKDIIQSGLKMRDLWIGDKQVKEKAEKELGKYKGRWEAEKAAREEAQKETKKYSELYHQERNEHAKLRMKIAGLIN